MSVQEFEGLPGTYLIDCGWESKCREASTYLYSREDVKYAYSAWVRQRSLRSLGDDPLFPQQWHLHNTGQNGIFGEDIRALDSWIYTSDGANHIIGVVDEGVEIAHPDLIENATPGLHWDYVDSDADPTAGRHGTAVAGIAGARGGNALGVSGAAPFAGIAGIRLLDLSGFVSDLDEANALNHQSDQIAIYNNSWGPVDNGNLDGPSPMTIAALEQGTSNGRQGRGNIYVWAAGNGKLVNDNANYDGYANQPYVIAVSATNSSGIQTFYSEPGANIWLNAPGGDSSGLIATTDTSGPAGYSGTDYTTSFAGTSATSPQVAGVVAMMLDQNPNLSWRDVKLILAQSATRNDPADADWVQNGAGYWINHKYGFGRVDAFEAVTRASTHTPLPPLIQDEKGLSPNLPIPDNNPAGIASDITLENSYEIEFVQVMVDSDHPYWGDLKIELISPAGTVSTLSDTHNSSGNQLSGGWTFGSARYLGEQSAGTWRLQIADGALQDAGTLNSWTIRIYGHSTQGQGTGATPIPSLGLPGLLVLSLTLVITVATRRQKFKQRK
jgi:kexin